MLVGDSCICLAAHKGYGPDLIYLPEITFNMDKFNEVAEVYNRTGKVLVAFSEGCKDEQGRYIAEMGAELSKDSFGHAQLVVCCFILANRC